jgi:hypothetical protein
VVRRRGAKRHPTSRVARVEEKLDDLVSLLRVQERVSGRGASKENVDGGKATALNEEPEPSESEPDTATSPAAFLTPAPANGTDGSTDSSQAAPTPSVELPRPYEPSASEAEESLRKFRDETIVFSPTP